MINLSSLSYLFLVMSDWAILILRLVIGVVLLAHSIPKLKDLKGTANWFSSVGFKPGGFWAPLVAIVEIVGGIGFILGILVQPLALIISIQFLVISIWKIITKKPLIGGFELDLIILAATLVLLSVDTRLSLLGLIL